jgi:predicted nucleotidyltransferase component of viral defense system
MMTYQSYNRQVALLLKVLPEVAKEENFALHGGTAINLFVRNMPRLSVDIDLTYVPVEDRSQSIAKINIALATIRRRIEQILPTVKIQHNETTGKLMISLNGVMVKLEVNLVGRGLLGQVTERVLCNKSAEEYDSFVAIKTVSFGQLYGGKICAALDRQHPRDLFDIKLLLENEGLSREVLQGFLLSLVSSDRPIYEILKPNLLDQRPAMENQFNGMTTEVFGYDDFEVTRKKLIMQINESLTAPDKEFLLGFKGLTPDWSIYNFAEFPAVRWKLQNLEKLKNSNPKKYQQQLVLLERHLAL